LGHRDLVASEGIQMFDAQYPASDWTRACAWLQCVAYFSKDKLNG
jgi:hypothetical protein